MSLPQQPPALGCRRVLSVTGKVLSTIPAGGQPHYGKAGAVPLFIVLRVWAPLSQLMCIGAAELPLLQDEVSAPSPSLAKSASPAGTLPKHSSFTVTVPTLMFSFRPWNPSLYFSTRLFPGKGCLPPPAPGQLLNPLLDFRQA